MNIKKLLPSTILALGLGAGSAQAIDIAGITIDAGAQIDTLQIFENLVFMPGDVLTGYGSVNTINGTNAFCTGGGLAGIAGACELTLAFGGYTVSTINGPGTEITFSGGWVNLYSDTTPDFNPFTSGSQVTDLANATNGTLWLTLAGHDFVNAGGTNVLFGTGTGIGTAGAAGTGTGALSIDDTGLLNGNTVAAAGAANANFDTNTFGDGLGGFFDISFGSDFSTLASSLHPQIPLSGGGNFKAEVIPEPATLALLGLGLLGLGAARKRKA